MYNYEDLSLESKNIINRMNESLEMVAKNVVYENDRLGIPTPININNEIRFVLNGKLI